MTKLNINMSKLDINKMFPLKGFDQRKNKYSDDPYYYHSPEEDEISHKDIDQEADAMQRVRDMK